MKEVFPAPRFFSRLKGMLGVDFYRLFHTPVYYIFLAIAAIVPALVSMGAGETEGMFRTAWEIVAAPSPAYLVKDMGEYANMNMVFIFGGIMIAVFIGHDYGSGYVKQLFTTHPKKCDYVLSKSLAGAFSMACMCITYLIGGMLSGAFTGLSFRVNAGALLLAILGKIVLCLGWSSFYTFVAVLFRRYFGISVVLCFAFGTGIHVIAAAATFGSGSALNVFLYGSSVAACLSSDIVTLLVCFAVSAAWAAVYNALGTLVLSRRDVY